MAKKQSTAEYYRKNKAARDRRLKQQAEYNKRPDQVKKRTELNKANRKAGTYGKMKAMGKDRSHTKDGKLVLEDAKTNRRRNGANGKSTKK